MLTTITFLNLCAAFPPQAMYPVFCQEVVATAYCVAARAHKGQQRKDGSPLISHCLNIAKLLASMGLDTETVAAGLLHESLASANSSIYQSQLEEFMPSSVVAAVERVNTISEMSRIYRQASGQLVARPQHCACSRNTMGTGR